MLNNIQTPADIAGFSINQLNTLADEIRDFLINSVEQTGGHLAPNLGTIELTLAIHHVFNLPDDSLVWDVGHQSYTHKILTGRKDLFHTLRQKDGLSGFTKRSESPYDAFGAGHSSTSISAALGIAVANKLNNNHRTAIAVIGDGALTGGMAFEALNHAGDSQANLLIILNDNDMSISKNVGGLNKYLTRLMSGKIYSTMREKSLDILNKTPSIREFARRSEAHFKGFLSPATLFEELGVNYFGPIDGHDINELVKTLKNLSRHQGIRLLHIDTTKGKGLIKAEQDPCKFHGVSPSNNQINLTYTNHVSYSEVFGHWLCHQAKTNQKIIGITPAMCTGSGMNNFAKQYPKQYFDVGIAEQHAITFAGGLAVNGYRPIVAIYSTFLQRGYDQLIHDIALQNLPVIFAIDRAGLVGADGPTHAGAFDLSFLNCIPNLTIMTPSSAKECYQMLNTALSLQTPTCIRYPRGSDDTTHYQSDDLLPIGIANTISTGKQIALLAFGTTLNSAIMAGKQLNATVVDMRFTKPLDEALLLSLSQTHQHFISLEDNAVIGGGGSLISQFLHQQNLTTQLHNVGLPDYFTQQGTQAQLWQQYHLDSHYITQYCEKNI